MVDSQKIPEAEKREQWLSDLAQFIVEANAETYAADKGAVSPEDIEREGYKELEYTNGDWRLRDSYTGYFGAPGMTTVYYKGKPAWTMSYGGVGQSEAYYDIAKETFGFLKRALMEVKPDLPFRGPQLYEEGNNTYLFKMIEGDITGGIWRETILENGNRTFYQTGVVSLVIGKDSSRNPVYPWNL